MAEMVDTEMENTEAANTTEREDMAGVSAVNNDLKCEVASPHGI